MKRYYFASIFILLLQTTLIYGQTIYQTQYYKEPPKSGIININRVNVVKDTSEKKIKSLKQDKRLVVLQNLGLAKQYLLQNDILAVYDCLEKVDDILLDLPETLYIRALTHWKINDISFARHYFLKALEVGTDNYSVFEDAAIFFKEVGLYTDALNIYLQAYKKSKDASWLFLGAELALNFDERSANYYFVLLAKSNYDGFGIEGLSDIAYQNGLYDTALHGYSVAIEKFEHQKYKKIKLSENNISRVNEKIGMTKVSAVIADWQDKFENEEYTAALDILKTISHSSAAEKSVFLLNAKTYAELGRYLEAQTLIEYSMNQDNSLEDAYIVAAQVEFLQGRTNEAISIIEDGLNNNYDKTALYNVFLNFLDIVDSKYYYDSILLELSKVSDPGYQQAIMLAKYYLERNNYKQSLEIIEGIEQTKEVLLFRERIDDMILLEQSEENRKSGKYKNVVADLSQKEFSGKNEEDLRVRLLSNALCQLGDSYTAIQLLIDKVNNETLSLNNTYYLQYIISLDKNSAYTDIVSEDVIKNIDEWVAKISSNNLYVRDRVNEFLLFGQFAYAIDYLNELKQNTNFNKTIINNLEAKVYSQIAGKFYDKKNIVEAKKYTALAISKNKNDIDANYISKLLNLYDKWGDIENYMLEDNYDVTIAMANDFLYQIPARIDIRMILIRALALNKDTEAISIMKRINSMYMYDHLKCSILSDIYYGFEMYDYSASLYKQSLENHPDDMYTEVMYIQTLEKLGRIDEALKLALDIETKYTNNSYIQYLLSKLYLSKGNIDKAFSSINNAIMKFDNIKYQFQLGLCYEASSQVQTAFDLYADILQENKYYSDAYVHLIEILLENKKTIEVLDRAKSLSETLITFNPNDAYYYYLLADSYYNIAFFNTNTDLDEQIKSFKTTLLFFQNAMNRSIYGNDSKLRVLIKDKMIILNNSIKEAENTNL